jgi:phosphohistidine swiveling domain-containing protein
MKWVCAQSKTHSYVSPMIYSVGVIYADTMKSILDGVCFGDTVAYCKDMVMYWYAMVPALDKAAKKAFEIVKKDPAYLHNLRNKFVEFAPTIVEFAHGVSKKDLKTFSDKELWGLYNKYLKMYDEIYTYGEPITLGLNDSLGGYLRDYLEKKTKSKKDLTKYYNTLISPTEMSFIKREEIDLLKIGVIIKNTKGVVKLFNHDIKSIKNGLNNFPEINKMINDHVKAYEWVPYDYGVTTWTKDYFLDALKIILDRGDILERLDQDENYYKKLSLDQEGAIVKLNIDNKHSLLFQALRDCAFLMDYKKEEFTKSHLYIRPLIVEIARRFGLTRIECRYLLPEEIKKYLLSGKKPNKELIHSRTKLCLVYWKGRKVSIYEKDKVQEIFDSLIKEPETSEIAREKFKIDGIIASSGKAVGKVKVVKSSDDIAKVNDGDILVAVMTSPDYVVGMKKAAAIITDEGGITCHAAIVSRELGVPCIVGTKIATKHLVDGELLEVNANHGSVRIVKKRNKE